MLLTICADSLRELLPRVVVNGWGVGGANAIAQDLLLFYLQGILTDL